MNLSQLYYQDAYALVSDKGVGHSYIPFYSELFEDRRNKISNFVELGVCRGGSISLWREYFPHNVHIYGVDIYPPCSKYERLDKHVHIVIEDCTTPAILNRLPQSIDILIDDASHILENTKKTLDLLYERISPGGLYIIEDIIPDDISPLVEAARIRNLNFSLLDLRHERRSTDNVLLVIRK